MLAARLLRRGLEPFLARTAAGLRFVFSDGQTISNASGEPEATITFRSTRAEWNAVTFGHIGLLESFFAQDIDIDGDLCAVFRASYDSHFSRPNPLVAVRNRWHEWRYSNRTIAQARDNARAHYGLPREFFQRLIHTTIDHCFQRGNLRDRAVRRQELHGESLRTHR